MYFQEYLYALKNDKLKVINTLSWTKQSIRWKSPMFLWIIALDTMRSWERALRSDEPYVERETSRLRPSVSCRSGLSREIQANIGASPFPLLRQLFTDSS